MPVRNCRTRKPVRMFAEFSLIEYTVPFDEFPAFLMVSVDCNCIITSGCALLVLAFCKREVDVPLRYKMYGGE